MDGAIPSTTICAVIDGPSSVRANSQIEPVRYTVLSRRVIVWTGVVVVLVGVGAAVGLLAAFGDGGQQQRNQLDAVRTAGTLVLGAGGVVALLLAARRQRSTEIALQQKDRDQAHQEEIAKAAQEDATERRITELYTKAADQLGAATAPVRLAGLYALERLAQDNPRHRQTIVNLMCAYLRMPYPVENPREYDRHLVEEREVRVAVQHVLADHLRPQASAEGLFWVGIDLNLRGATLLDLDLTGCHMAAARFDGARFAGDTRFVGVTFHETARFDGARYLDTAWFSRTIFKKNASFTLTRFGGEARFDGARCEGTAWFTGASFVGAAQIDGPRFAHELVGLLPGVDISTGSDSAELDRRP
jgi:hypothetical protein